MSTLRVRIVLPAGTTPLPRFVLVSAALHVIGLTALLVLPGLIAPRRTDLLPTLDAVLVSPLAQPARTTGPPRPPVARPQAKAPEPKPVDGPSATPVEPPKPTPLPPERPKPQAAKPPEPKPEPVRPPEQPAVDPDESTGEDLDDYGGESGPIAAPGGGAALAGMGVEFDWYRDAVVRALFTAWRQPFSGSIREPLEVAVSFEILRDGTVKGIQFVSQSGDSRLDRSAFRAVQDASLPPLPRNYRVSAQPAMFVFRLFPDQDP